MFLPTPVTVEEHEYVIEAALSGEVITGPWGEALDTALDELATDPSDEHERTARSELAQWVTDWNESLPA